MPARPNDLRAPAMSPAPADPDTRRGRPRTVRLPAGVTVPAVLDPVAKLRCAAWHLMAEGRWAEAAKLAARAARYAVPKQTGST